MVFVAFQRERLKVEAERSAMDAYALVVSSVGEANTGVADLELFGEQCRSLTSQTFRMACGEEVESRR